MDYNSSVAVVKDPMRDSLLSSDCEVDPDPSQPGTPCEDALDAITGPITLHSNGDNGKSGSHSNGTEVCGNDLGWIQGTDNEETWEGVGQGLVICRRDTDDANVGNDVLLSSGQSSLDNCQQDAQPELEFDYWQGQFEFCSPALQDYHFIPVKLLERLAGSSAENGSVGGSVCKDLIDTVKILQSKVEVLGDNQSDSQDRIVRVKQENSVLQNRVLVLEEQLREAEQRAQERLAEEQRRNRELIHRIEREKTLTVENYSIRQVNLEKTNERLEEELQRLRSKVERHQKERHELEDRAVEAEVTANALREETKKAAGQSRRELQDDQERSAGVIASLRAEVERLTAVIETSGRMRLPSTDSAAVVSDQMTAALAAIKDENRGLHEQVEELQAQLLTRGLEEGRELTALHSTSLAAEFEAMSQEEAEEVTRETLEELQKSLRDAQEVNKHLRSYIDGILLNIVENYPQLLEVKHKPSS